MGLEEERRDMLLGRIVMYVNYHGMNSSCCTDHCLHLSLC